MPKHTGEETMPTMADVARRAGVSAMTVSRALKQGTHVSAKTRAKILYAVSELGYVLDQSAGSLSSRKTGFVAAIIPSINNSNFAETARGITDGLDGSGLQLLLGYTDYSLEREQSLIQAMLRRRPEGIIVTGGDHTPVARHLLIKANIPTIETWEIPAEPIHQVVGFSNYDAMALMVKTLAQKGYQKFAYIGGSSGLDTRGAMRKAGFISALGELGLTAERIISFGEPPISMEQGSEAIGRLLDTWPDTEIVLCVSDLLAFGALMECHRRGVKVPQDIAIAGFGDYQIASYCYPRLTTMHVDCYGIGQLAAQQLIKAINTNKGRSERELTLTKYRVIEREST